MNKNICLLVFVTLMFASVFAEESHQVEFTNQNYWMNFITLIHVENMMFWCLMGAFTSLFWADGGYYYNNCFNNFVAKPVFY